jgi:hypothetical protein
MSDLVAALVAERVLKKATAAGVKLATAEFAHMREGRPGRDGHPRDGCPLELADAMLEETRWCWICRRTRWMRCRPRTPPLRTGKTGR